VDHDRLLIWVVIEDHHLQQATGPVRADEKIPAFAGNHSYGMTNSVKHVFVADAVLSCAVRDFRLDKVALSAPFVKAALSRAVASSAPGQKLLCQGIRLAATSWLRVDGV
jgi:hypothetical protein